MILKWNRLYILDQYHNESEQLNIDLYCSHSLIFYELRKTLQHIFKKKGTDKICSPW